MRNPPAAVPSASISQLPTLAVVSDAYKTISGTTVTVFLTFTVRTPDETRFPAMS